MNDAQKERLRKYHETSKKKEHDDEVDINKIMQEVKLESEGIKIYDNPAIWTKADIELHLDGGAFFYRSLSDSDELALLAKISYREGWTEKDYRRLLSKEADIGEIFPFKVMVCEPFEVPRGPIILRNIASWLKANSFNTFCDAITSRVMGQEDTKRVVANVYNYLQCLVSGKQHNNNILLAAPSGCGKTETYRAIRDYFKEKIPRLPVYQIDMTSVTEEGFKGNNTEYMVKELVTNFETQGIGIVFLDEFDKKLLPSYSSKGSNVNAAVQSQILTIIEGRIFEAGAVKINT
ncbi:MAG: AAA family ATPase, partial [Lachnospiraceae bacterium]|nr:AAA family ATPase [Lachnospiraceae bacterium]